MSAGALEIVVAGRDPAAVELLSARLGRSARIAIVGTGSDPEGLLRMIERRHPQIVVVAVGSDLACRLISRLREHAALPIVAVCPDATLGMASLSSGALEWVEESASVEKVVESARLMAEIRLVSHQKPLVQRLAPRAASAGATLDRQHWPGAGRPAPPGACALPRLVAIGGSTGAPVALLELLARLPTPLPAPVVVAQHMPHDYSEAFVHWLASSSGRQVRLALAGKPLGQDLVHVAPANQHTTLAADGTFRLERAQGTGPAPSVDRLFRSLALLTGFQRFAVLLTGMGRDGADALLALRGSGARTLAQDERSSVVFGMPGAAAELGAAEALLSPVDLGSMLSEWLVPLPGPGA